MGNYVPHFSFFMYFCKKYILLGMATKIGITRRQIVEKIEELWHPLSDGQKIYLQKHIKVRRYHKNDIIYKESEDVRYAMVLLEGKVKICREGLAQKIQILRVIQPIDFFGYRAHFANEDYKTCAKAIEDSIIGIIPINVIVTLIKINSEVSLYFIKRLSKELGVSDERTVHLTQKHIRGRLSEALLFLKENYGLEQDNQTIAIELSREELASLSNMTTNNAIRTLSSFAAEELVEVDKRKIKILKEKELEKISKLG